MPYCPAGGATGKQGAVIHTRRICCELVQQQWFAILHLFSLFAPWEATLLCQACCLTWVEAVAKGVGWAVSLAVMVKVPATRDARVDWGCVNIGVPAGVAGGTPRE